jgi:splicing factor U2AF 65 kDa subunit
MNRSERHWCTGNAGGVGNAVVNVYINYEKKFAFVEVRTVEEASNAMALDGIMFEGVAVRIRRPNDYNPAAAARHGPANPNPNLNLAAVNLTTGGVDSEDRVRFPRHQIAICARVRIRTCL